CRRDRDRRQAGRRQAVQLPAEVRPRYGDRRRTARRVARPGPAPGELERLQLWLDPDRERHLGHPPADDRRVRDDRERRGGGATASREGPDRILVQRTYS